MDTLNLNERIPLSDSATEELKIDFLYKFTKESFNTFVTAFICDENDSVIDQSSYVSYMNYTYSNSVIKYLGCNSINGESFKLALNNAPSHCKSIHFILASDSLLTGLNNLSVTLRDADGERIANFKDIVIEKDDTAIMLLEFRLSINKTDWLLTPKSEGLGKYDIDKIFSDLGIRTIA